MDLFRKHLLSTGLALCGTLHLLFGAAFSEDNSRPLSTREISTLATVNVPPEYVQQIRNLGYSDISVRDIVQLWTVRATPEYVRQIRELGYTDISVRDITQLSAVNVTPEYVRQIRELGYSDISVRDIVQLAAVNVTPEYIRNMRAENPGISIRDIVQLAATNVTSEYIAKMKESGLANSKIVVRAKPRTHERFIVHSSHTESGFFSNWLTQLVLGICLIIAAGGAVAYLNRSSRAPSSAPAENIDQRLSAFEQRATDVQDILMSINDRLNRRMNLG
ncbi:MAG: hypothetical protein O2954_05430 [bacterium]|nr:hypothetical protein [bacterium]